jgi:DNA-binding CsgD family transcriptional regulator
MNINNITLSTKETEVMDLLARWYVKDEEIAQALQISKGSAHNHVIRIMRLTGIHNRTMLIWYAQECGFGKNKSPRRITEALNPSMVNTTKTEVGHSVAEF